ncbi:tyrosine-type recombinase/integrase [Defluviimonas aestuarii]|uniref:site-specific integrase n=1 Tax=Albidovulum aestuarii TaxID=1130726 RepID=UPI00249B8492|nr:tyrosine-type recombinase/integrase [Defluviimonas aestuarii]MDI3337927.1 tyrosine-type recombinase/integrase [Defluviimonas aestuarii]
MTARKFNEDNERMKREYRRYLALAKGRDEKTIDKVDAALAEFEQVLGYKPFKTFHRDWCERFKRYLEKRRTATGNPLSLTTRDATLRLVKGFFHWLASQPGYKSRVTYSDVDYFNNNAKDARAAHSVRPKIYPSMEQCNHAFRNMPEDSEVEWRDKAIFALLMLTGARDSALASLCLKHVDLIENMVFQDGREVRTKNSKTIETWFFPVDPMYRAFFESWVRHLQDNLYGPADALFPKQTIAAGKEGFAAQGLSREPYSNAQRVRDAIKAAFRNVSMTEYGPHSFRTMLSLYGDKVCRTLEARKAWSQNLGHERLTTTYSAYMPVSRERQRDLLRGIDSM